jgi:hypothetical protein
MTQAVQYNVRDSQGNVYGPATADMLRQWVREGRIVAGMSIAPEGTDNWTEVSVHPGLSDLFGESPAVSSTPTTPTTPATPITPATSVTDTSIVDAPQVSVDPLGAATTPGTSTTPSDSASAAPTTGNTGVVRSAPAGAGLAYETPQAGSMNPIGLFSFIIGILALLSSISACCCYGTINGLLGLVALVLGLVASGQNRKEPGRYNNNWMATTGIILGGLAVLIGIVALVFMVIAVISSRTT